MTTLTRNKYDKRDSLEISLSSSESFFRAGEKLGWVVAESTQEQDMNEHWDYRIFFGSLSHRVELKAMKRLSRQEEVQDTWAWIELHGVRSWDKGWLINSKADYICFERLQRFEFYPRLELLERVLSLVDLTKWVVTSKEAKYCLYSRETRPDILTMVEYKKLEDLISFYWERV